MYLRNCWEVQSAALAKCEVWGEPWVCPMWQWRLVNLGTHILWSATEKLSEITGSASIKPRWHSDQFAHIKAELWILTSTSTLVTFGAGSFSVMGDCSVQCRMLTHPGLYPLDVLSIPQFWQPQNVPDLVRCPQRSRTPPAENQWPKSQVNTSSVTLDNWLTTLTHCPHLKTKDWKSQ